MSRTLPGNNISNLNTLLADEKYEIFKSKHFKNYNVVLAFTTRDKNKNATEQSIEDHNEQALKN